MLDMGFAEDLETILSATPEDAPDGALLGDDLAPIAQIARAPPAGPGARHGSSRAPATRDGARGSARSPTSSGAPTS